MTTKSDFTEEEWTRVVRAPLVAGLAISLADPGGPIEMVETMRFLASTDYADARAPVGGFLSPEQERRHLAVPHRTRAELR